MSVREKERERERKRVSLWKNQPELWRRKVKFVRSSSPRELSLSSPSTLSFFHLFFSLSLFLSRVIPLIILNPSFLSSFLCHPARHSTQDTSTWYFPSFSSFLLFLLHFSLPLSSNPSLPSPHFLAIDRKRTFCNYQRIVINFYSFTIKKEMGEKEGQREERERRTERRENETKR